MPELSHDTAEDGFHEIQLSGKQLVFLFIVTTSVVVGVFLFGVLVGRGAREPKAEEPTPVGATETAPAAPVTQQGRRRSNRRHPPQTLQPTRPRASEGADPAPTVEESKPAAPVREAAKEPPAQPPASSPAASEAASCRECSGEVSGARSDSRRAGSVPTTARPGTWLVQVMATREQASPRRS